MKTKTIIIVLAVVIILVVGYILFKKQKAEALGEDAELGDDKIMSSTKETTSKPINIGKPSSVKPRPVGIKLPAGIDKLINPQVPFKNNQNNTSDEFPLKLGSKGPKVLKMQKFLNTKFKANIQEDSEFGNETEKALNNAIGKKQLDNFTQLVFAGGLGVFGI